MTPVHSNIMALFASLPFVASVQGLLSSMLAPPLLPFGTFFALVVCGITAYGAFQGLLAWFRWLEVREKVELEFDWLAPVVNVILASTHLAWYVLSCAIGSALVTLTFPLSVPILVGCFGKKKRGVVPVRQRHGRAPSEE